MAASNQYNFKLVDFHVSKAGYFLKVAMLTPSSSSYRLVYIPYSKYPSVLMLEYLVASMKELPSDLYDVLLESVKEELSTEQGLVILLADWQDRPAELDIELIKAERPNEVGGEIDANMKEAFRPIDQSTRVFREVHLSKRVADNLAKLSLADMAYRVKDHQLFIDLAEPKATRSIASKLHVNREADQAQRIITAATTIPYSVIAAKRIISADTHLERQASWASRIIKHTGWVNHENTIARRIITRDSPVYIERDMFWGFVKQRVFNAILVRNMPLANKAIDRLVWINRDKILADRRLDRAARKFYAMTALRDIKHKIIIDRSTAWAWLRARQYPAHLHFSERALRHITSDLYVLRDFRKARRERNQDLFINRERILATRTRYDNPTFIDRTILNSEREIRIPPPSSRPTFLLKEYLEGRRVKDVDAYIERNFSQATRDKVSGTWIDRSISGGDRDGKRKLMVNRSNLQGKRKNDQPIYLPKDLLDSSRPQKKLHLSWSIQAARMEIRDLYLERIQQAKRNGDHPTFLDHTIGSDKKPYDSVLEELDWLGQKSGGLFGTFAEDFLAHVQHSHEGLYDDGMLGAFKEIRSYSGSIEELIMGYIVREMPGYFLDVIYGYRDFPSYLMDDVLVGIREKMPPSMLEFLLAAGLSPKPAFIEEFLAGAKLRLEALIESGIVGFQESRPSILTFGLEGGDRPHTLAGSEIPEELVAHEEAKPSLLPEELFAQEEAKPSIIPEGILAQEPPKPSILEEELLADDVFRPSILHIENPLGYFEPDESFLPEGVLADKQLDHGHVDEVMLAQEPDRPATLEEGQLGVKEMQGRNMIEIIVADRPDEKAATTMEESYEALLKQRIAELSSEFIFGDTGARAGHIADVYFLGEAAIRDGMLPEEDWANYAKLALEQAVIAEGMFATNPEKAALLVESILAFKGIGRDAAINEEQWAADHNYLRPGTLDEENVWADRDMDDMAYLEDGMFANPTPNPAILDPGLVAEKKDDAALILESILGDRELAQAIVMEYILAKEQERNGYIGEQLTATEQLKKAFLDKIGEMGQGLVYDYSDNLIDEGMNPEEWSGGFGVPEEYDPHDPFNQYFPWTEELDPLVLGQDDWVRFDSEPQTVWHRDRNLSEFYCDSENPGVTGFYRNDFTHEDYVFDVSFKVNETAGDDGAGIIFRYTDPQNYYMFMVNGGDPDGSLGMVRPMQLYRVSAGVSSSMAAPMNSFIWTPEKWHQLQVSVIGNRIKLLVNGRLQYDFTD